MFIFISLIVILRRGAIHTLHGAFARTYGRLSLEWTFKTKLMPLQLQSIRVEVLSFGPESR